jgi:hypothetical protein
MTGTTNLSEPMTDAQLDQLSIDTIRTLSIDAVLATIDRASRSSMTTSTPARHAGASQCVGMR